MLLLICNHVARPKSLNMADLQTTTTQSNSKRRAKKQSTRVDMTPMVDLAFLLLTFFVLTATFSKQKSMELSFPAPGEPSHLRNGITFLLSKDNRLFYYEGEFRTSESESRSKTQLLELSFSQNAQNSLHTFLLSKNKTMQDQIRYLADQHSKGLLNDSVFKQKVVDAKSNSDAFTYLIKPDANATYGNVIDVIDELNINVVGKYVVADLATTESELVEGMIALK
ncbi:hypothetical protein CNR22_13365 [Sphingobacteriaceae bacterium]|nr:hypothetical protein CNR22_13365 [Sphingobacteriaceae bacterium]